MNTEKKWKRGDIGPDGRVFWAYGNKYRNGERWIDADGFQQLHENRKEQSRRYIQENREKVTEVKRRYHQKNREKAAEARRRRIHENREKYSDASRRDYQENREKYIEATRRYRLKKTLKKSTPKTLHQFYALSPQIQRILAAIFSLTPDEGQTLAELIHELSGYPMELCEQIANPSEPEPEPQPTPEPQPALKILPDLF